MLRNSFLSHETRRSRRAVAAAAVLTLVASLIAPIAGAVSAQANTNALTITPTEWNVVGLDSNNVLVGPNQYSVGARVCNITAAPLAGITITWQWNSANTFVNIDGALTKPTFTLAANTCVNRWWTVEVTRNALAYDTTRLFQISASAPNAFTVTTPAAREIYVEALISQNRNSTTSLAGPTDVFVGDLVTYVLDGKTATNGYEQLSAGPTLDGSLFDIVSVAATYDVPTGATNTFYYADACGWDPVIGPTPPTGTYLSCKGPELFAGGKAGGNPILVTVTARVIAAGTGTVIGNIYDYSGSSFHYNADVASITVTSRVPTGSFSLQKSVSDPGNVVPDNTVFTVRYSVNGAASVPVQLTAGAAPVVVSGLPTGATVTFTEDAPPFTGVNWGSPVFTPSSASITIGNGTTVPVTVSNPFALQTGSFSLQKQVTGVNPALVPSGTVFTVRYSVNGAASVPVQLTAGAAPVVVSGLSTGATVTFTEDAPSYSSVNWGAPVFSPVSASITIGNGTTVPVTVSNPFTLQTGSFSLQKSVTDPGNAVPDSTVFTVRYSVNGAASVPVQLTAGAAPVVVSGIPTGATVTFTEDAPPFTGVNWGAPLFSPVSASITIGNGTTVQVTVSNPFTLQTPSISVVKSVASIDLGADGVLGAGDEITYAFTVTNTGNVALSGVKVTDARTRMSGAPISLAVGASDSTTFTATYEVTAADVTAGGVENTATVAGSPPSGDDVTDVSDAGTDAAGDPVVSPESVETASPLGALPNSGTDPTDDPTTVRILPSAADDEDLNNTIGDAVIVDVLANDSDGVVPSTVQLLTPGTGVLVTSLPVSGEGTWSVNATTGAVTFTPLATFLGDPAPVDYQAANGFGDLVEATVTITYVDAAPSISVVKSVDSIDLGADAVLGAGDEVTYAFTVTNTGNVSLSDVTVTDVLATMSGGPISLAVGASDSTTFTATYEVTAADVTAGGVENTATAVGSPPSGDDVTDVSDAGTDANGDPVSSPELVETPSPLGALPNSGADPTDDPTTVRILPSAADDEDLDNTVGDAVTVAVLANDSAGVVASTVQLLTPGTGVPVSSLTVDGEGQWTVDALTGAVTFTPLSTFTGDPTPVEYRAANGAGDTVEATITITYVAAGTGSFSLVKEVVDDPEDLVPDTAEYTVRYSVDGANPIAVTLIAGADPVVVAGLPLGAVVTFTEDEPPAFDEVLWLPERFSPESASITITEGLTPVSVTNAIDLTTLALPTITSRAYVDGVPNGKITRGPATIVDRVFYSDVTPEQDYRLSGELVYIENGVIVFTGITGSGLFTPAAADGTTEVLFELSQQDVEELGSKTLYIFLTLFNSADEEVAFDGADIASDPWFDATEEWVTVAPTLDLAITGASPTIGLVAGGLGAVAAGLLLVLLGGRRRRSAVRASAS